MKKFLSLLCILTAALLVFCGAAWAEEAAETETTVYHVGDTVTTSDGMIEFKLLEWDFAKALEGASNFESLTPVEKTYSGNPYQAKDGKVPMYFYATFTLIGESKQNVGCSMSYVVDYDDGYLFKMGTNSSAFCLTTVDFSAERFEHDHPWFVNGYSASSEYFTFEPLTKRWVYGRFAIMVPEQLEENPEKVLLYFTINDDTFTFSMPEKEKVSTKVSIKVN